MPTRRPKVHVYDSAIDEELPEHRRYAISYEPVWQSIRHSLRWAEYENAVASLAMCDGYVGLADPENGEQLQRRTWRVFNLLCAIPHNQSTAVGIRVVERNSSAILIPAMDRYRERIDEVGYPTVWDWNWSRINAIKMHQATPETFFAIHKTLRIYRGSKHRTWHSKPEMWYYLNLIQEVIDGQE